MAAVRSPRWEQIRSRRLADPILAERYERTRRALSATRRVLQLIDDERQRAGLTKTNLAQRVGTAPSAVRRLLTSEAGNPTLRTLVEMSEALGLELTLRRKAGVRKTPASRKLPAAVRSVESVVG